MHLTKLTPERYKRMPWKNGGGMTTELLAEPKRQGDGFLWRISIAEVAMSGPFSDFSDYLRSIMLLEGNGFILKCADAAGTVMGGKRLDRPYEPFAFDGAWATECSLIDGPIKDFNLMVDRRRMQGALQVQRLAAGAAQTITVRGTAVIHLLKGAIEAGPERLEAGDTLRIDADRPTELRLAATAQAICAIATLQSQ